MTCTRRFINHYYPIVTQRLKSIRGCRDQEALAEDARAGHGANESVETNRGEVVEENSQQDEDVEEEEVEAVHEEEAGSAEEDDSLQEQRRTQGRALSKKLATGKCCMMVCLFRRGCRYHYGGHQHGR